MNRSTVLRSAKLNFGLVVGKRTTTKTGSRDPGSKWAMSRLAIAIQFRNDIMRRRARLEQTLFVDEHSEFCVLGRGAHHGQSNRWEWCAHRKDGNICLPGEGGTLDMPVPQPKAKNPARADGIFGVCAPFPSGGRRQEGRRMAPLRYTGKVVGINTYERALKNEIERVRQLGLVNRANIADPDKRSRPGVWHDHVDEGVNPYEVSATTAAAFYNTVFLIFSLLFPLLKSRFGPDWRTKLPANFEMYSIKTLIDHVIDEGNRLFADTAHANNWMI